MLASSFTQRVFEGTKEGNGTSFVRSQSRTKSFKGKGGYTPFRGLGILGSG
jgi:hypothetical protein